MATREADLLPVGYFHVVFTVPGEIANIAFHNKAVVYDLLFRTASETMLTIAADPRHLGARIGITAVLHTWGSALTHHPHIHMVVPGGGISLDGQQLGILPACLPAARPRPLQAVPAIIPDQADGASRCRPDPVLRRPCRFERAACVPPLHRAAAERRIGWSTPSRPSLGPEAVLAYLSRYTHRVAISNRRLIALDEAGVTFRYKDYRRDGPDRQRMMTLAVGEFIRRFLLHVLPKASTVSATTACSPAAVARQISRVPANCSRLRQSQRRRRLLPPHQKILDRHAHAVAAAWSSSKFSNAGCNRARRRGHPREPG